jgi:acetyltransferase EpsM
MVVQNNKTIYILGAGSMAKETYQIYLDAGKKKYVAGFLINTPSAKESLWDKKIYQSNVIDNQQNKILLIAGIGNPVRKYWVEELKNRGYEFDRAVHESATIGYNTKIGPGSIICAEATLTCDIIIGSHVILNNNATVNHDCVFENFVTIGPGANIGGKVTIGEGSFIGIGSILSHNIKIGARSFIGAGSVVISDIPDDVLAYGAPAKPIRKIDKKDWNNLI